MSKAKQSKDFTSDAPYGDDTDNHGVRKSDADQLEDDQKLPGATGAEAQEDETKKDLEDEKPKFREVDMRGDLSNVKVEEGVTNVPKPHPADPSYLATKRVMDQKEADDKAVADVAEDAKAEDTVKLDPAHQEQGEDK